MKKFLKSKRTKLVCEIPLLIESKLMKNFDKIIFIDAKEPRLKRHIVKSGNKQLFDILDKNQIKARNKEKFYDYKIVNNRSKEILKKCFEDNESLNDRNILRYRNNRYFFQRKDRVLEIAWRETQDLIPTNNVFHKIITKEMYPMKHLKCGFFKFLKDKVLFKDIVEEFLIFVKNKKLLFITPWFGLFKQWIKIIEER